MFIGYMINSLFLRILNRIIKSLVFTSLVVLLKLNIWQTLYHLIWTKKIHEVFRCTENKELPVI